MVKSKSARKKKAKQEKNKHGSDSEEEEEEEKKTIDQKIEEEGKLETQKTTKVVMCPYCDIPLEYCEFKTEWEKCKEYMEKNHPKILEGINASKEMDKLRKKETKTLKVKKSKNDNEVKLITVAISRRSKKKSLTLVYGFEERGINTKKVAGFFKKTFACGCTEKKDEHQKVFVEIQGDVRDQLPDLLLNEYKIDSKEIVFLAEKKKKKDQDAQGEEENEE
eukprot:gene7134-11447_t